MSSARHLMAGRSEGAWWDRDKHRDAVCEARRSSVLMSHAIYCTETHAHLYHVSWRGVVWGWGWVGSIYNYRPLIFDFESYIPEIYSIEPLVCPETTNLCSFLSFSQGSCSV